jgi:hypothetical protein
MKKQLICAALLLAAASSSAYAQDRWAYQTVNPNNNTVTLALRSPVDLTYPPEGVRAPVIDERNRGIAQAIPLTVRQEAERMARPRLIITLISSTEADHLYQQELR